MSNEPVTASAPAGERTAVLSNFSVQKLGALHDPAGDFSSKRFESLMAFLAAVLVIVLSIILAACSIDPTFGGKVPLTSFVIALLGYSAAMQGISWGAEANLFPQGQNTGGLVGTVQGIVKKITGGGEPPSDVGGGN